MNHSIITSRHKFLAIASLLVGVALGIFGMAYNVYHLDDALDGHKNFILQYSSFIGLLLIILAPLFLRRYIWTAALLGLAVVIGFWMYFLY